MKFLKILFTVVLFSSFFSVSEVKACHAMALTSFSIDTVSNTGGIIVSGSSNPATFGCSGYWMDIEVRCINEDFEGAMFNPGFYGPLAAHPYFQSPSQLVKNSSSDPQQYEDTFVPFSELCPGVQYKIRARENHNGNVGPWTAPLYFTAPGVQTPGSGYITATPPAVCPGDPVELEAFFSGGCGLSNTYEWYSTPDTGTPPTTIPPLAPWVSTGLTGNPVTVFPTVDTWYSVIVEDVCYDTSYFAMILVSMLPPPDPGIAEISDTVICEGEIVDVSLSSYTGTIQWQISTNNGVSWNNIPNETTDTYTSSPLNVSTCYRAEVFGCNQYSYSNEVCVVISPYPVADFNWDPACEGYAVDFNNQSSANGVSFEWDFGNGNTSNDENPSNVYNSLGDFDVELIVVNIDGCGDTITQTITVYPNPIASFESDSVCFQQFNNFTNTSTVSSLNNDEIISWDWSFGDGNTSGQENPEHGYIDEGVYGVTLIVTTNNGCSDTIMQTATVWPLPDPAMLINDNCVTLNGEFTDQSTVSNDYTNNVITEWLWEFGDGGTSSDQNPNYVYNNTGDYEVILTVTSANGCTNSTSDSLAIIDFANADFDHTPTGGSIPLEVDFFNNSTGGSTYEWDFGNGVTDFSTSPDDHTIFYYQPGTYIITLTVGNGICETEDTALLVVDDYPDIIFNLPNVITPNGDDVNDVLHFDLRNVARVEVRIYNRWGNLVGLISSSENQLGWDATDRATGQAVSDGVYFYTYEFHALNGEVVTGHNYVQVTRDN